MPSCRRPTPWCLPPRRRKPNVTACRKPLHGISHGPQWRSKQAVHEFAWPLAGGGSQPWNERLRHACRKRGVARTKRHPGWRILRCQADYRKHLDGQRGREPENSHSDAGNHSVPPESRGDGFRLQRDRQRLFTAGNAIRCAGQLRGRLGKLAEHVAKKGPQRRSPAAAPGLPHRKTRPSKLKGSVWLSAALCTNRAGP